MKPNKVIGYVLTREDSSQWLFLGISPEEVKTAIANEIAENGGLDLEDIASMRIEPREFTHEQLDNMQEFAGW